MFGVLYGAGCGMAPGERQQWQAHICGVCGALQRIAGPLCRAATHYDAALLSALCSAQGGAETPVRSEVCLLRRPFRAAVVTSDAAGTQYGAVMALLMSASKLRDHVTDGEGWPHRLRGLAVRTADHWTGLARRAAATLRFDTELIERPMRTQAAVEAEPNRDFLFYSQPTELAAGAAFAHTAVLAGQPSRVPVLEEVGRMFGRIMYLLDSYQDYEQDLRVGRFNALAAAGAGGGLFDVSGGLFAEAHGRLAGGLQALTLPRPVLVHTLLEKQLHRKGTRLWGWEGCRSGVCSMEPDGGPGAGLPPGTHPAGHRRRYSSGCNTGDPCGGCLECCSCGCDGRRRDCCCCDCTPGDCNCCECKIVDCSGGDCNCCDCNCIDCSGGDCCCGGDCNCCECSGCDCN